MPPPPPAALLPQGEHKCDEQDLATALGELVSKMTGGWNVLAMRGLPYLLCLAAAGNLVQFCAIFPPAGGAGGDAVLHTLTDRFDMSTTIGRLKVLRVALNLARVFATLCPLLQDAPLQLYKQLARPTGDGDYIEAFPDHVRKVVCRPAPQAVYDSMVGLPCAVRVVSRTALKGGHVELRIEPVCLQMLPRDEPELRDAIRCVLTALVVFHLRGMVHRDVRWPNVLMYRHDQWVLADFELADADGADLPLGAVQDTYLPPELLLDGSRAYTAKGDVYRVGRLVREWADAKPSAALSAAGRDFIATLCVATPGARPTAEGALTHAWLR